MSVSLDDLKIQHEKICLERRAIDRDTEDVRTKTIEDKRKNEELIEKMDKDIEEKKELVAALNEKNKVLATTLEMTERDTKDKQAKQEADYDEKRRAKQKLQYMESKLCTKKVNIEKDLDPVQVMQLALKELDEQVEYNKNEREEVKKEYETEMNRLSNIIAKKQFQVDSMAKKIGSRQQDNKVLKGKLDAAIDNGRTALYGKDLLIKRLEFDTARVTRAIPKIEAEILHLETNVPKVK